MLPIVYEAVPCSHHSPRKRAAFKDEAREQFYDQTFEVFYYLVGGPMTIEELSRRLGRKQFEIHCAVCWLVSHAFVRVAKPVIRRTPVYLAPVARPSFADRLLHVVGGALHVKRNVSTRAGNSQHPIASGRRILAA